MGSSSSRMNSTKSSSYPPKDLPGLVGSLLNRTKRKISSLFCGASTSNKSTFELEHRPEKPFLAPINDDSQNLIVETSNSTHENADSSRRNTSIIEEDFVEPCLSSIQRSTDQTNFINGNELHFNQPPRNGGASSTISLAAEAQDSVMEATIVLGRNNSHLRSLSSVSGSLPRSPLSGDVDAHVTTTSSSGLLASNSVQNSASGDLLHLDAVSTSTNLLINSTAETSSRESRRNSRMLHRDELSRHGSTRHADSPTIIRRYERRRLLRSGISERIIGGPNERGQQITFCPTGIHFDGTCSCNLFFTEEEFSTLASISRIIMLADTLFEVLDEINHQSLSLFVSSLSLPAPESIVDALPVKYYKKMTEVESDSQQCHICLVEYDEDDKLRVLPCNHEYHLPCIDKWLKDINRVCPLCRYNVCEDHGEEDPVSNLEASTQ